jgi:hypothetical protein
MTPFLNRNGLYLQSLGFSPNNMSQSKNIFINGLYESPDYFNDIEDILHTEFTPIYQPLKKNIWLYSLIYKNESVCVSIRRGDFMSDKNKNIFNVCTKLYFINAINRMKKICPGAIFIFFSDDIVWCRENFYQDDNNNYFEIGDDPVWEKLRLMYSCKHFVISNSTFSWWAQWLSKNTQKIVISPNYWLNIKGFNSPLIDHKFITLPIEREE